MSKTLSLVPLKNLVEPVERPEAPIPGKLYKQIGVRLWGEGAYQRESIDGSQTKYKKLSKTETNDIIVNKIWARNGSVTVIPSYLSGCYVSSEFPSFKPNLDELEPRWFYWFTKTKSCWQQCDEKSRGTSGKNRIRPEKFLEIKIPLPPIEEQRRIVAKIEELAGKIEEVRSLREQTIKETEAVINSSAKKILSNVKADLTKFKDWLDNERGGIQTGPFGAQLGSSDYLDSGIPVLTIGNVQFDGLHTQNLKYVNETKAEQLIRYRVKEGDILFARMGTVGRCCVVPKETENWLINYHIIRLAPNQTLVESRYLHWIIRASKEVEEYLEEKIRGATRKGVNSKIVGGLPCRIPSISEQQHIVTYLDRLQNKVDEMKHLREQSLQEIDALLPSILDKAFKGEL